MRSEQGAAQPRGGAGVRFRTPERPVDRPARGLSPDLCVVGKDAPQHQARGLTDKGCKQVGRRLPGGSAASQARPSRSSQIPPSQKKVGHDQALTPDRVSTLLQSLGIAADSVLVDRVLHEIRHAAGADRGESQTAAQAVVRSAEDSTRTRAPRLPAASADSRGRVPGLLEEVLGDFQGELDDFRPVPAATSPLRSPEALLAKLRAVRLKRGLGIAELQALGDVNGDGRLTAVELGKVFAAVGINADEELVYEVWRHIDTNHNGQVSLFELFQAMKPSTTEVLTALSHVKYRRHASLSTLFRPYDSNGDDKLTPAEFHRMLNDLGFELDDEGVRDLLQVIVRDRDGGNLLSLRDLTLALESLERQAGRPDLRMGGSSKAGAVESTLPRSPDRLVMESPKRSPERPMTAPAPGTEAVPSQESQAQKASKLAELQNPVVPFKHAIKRLDPCGLPLGAQAWESLNRIFYRLAQQSKEVSTRELILAIRSDVRIKTEGLLHRPVIATDDGGPTVSLDEALHQVETQVLDGIGHLEMVSWDRFYWLLLEAHRHRAARHLLPVPLRAESPPNPAVKTSPRSLMNCPVDPNESPAASIQWLAQECSCNEEMLYRLYEKFTYCCGGDLVHVPRERFLQTVQNSENLYAALTTTPLLSGRPVVVKPMNWGDVLWQLSRREASLLSWSDIVATVCWCRAWSLGLSESEALHVSPRVRPSSASAAKARVEALLQNRAADATDNRAKPSPLQPSFAVPQITRMQDMQSSSPLETVSRRLAEASGSGFETRTQRSRHPWLDDSDDDVPSRVSVSRVPAPEVPRLSNEAIHSHGKSPGPAPVALRLQMPEGRPPPDPKELQRLELELARILNMPVQAVKLQGLRP